MRVVRTIREMQELSATWKRSGGTVGLVPTMGALHEGHLCLVDVAKSRARHVVVSLFVNPIQFGANEDFDRYPREEASDVEKLGKREVAAVFCPSVEEMYPSQFETRVVLNRLPKHMCGLRREGHFDGVATVVLKLFSAVLPDTAVFGEKDYQQLLVIRKMARDLNLPVEIVAGPTVREPDGLAMSSRNAYLSPDDRKTARCLYQALLRARQLVTSGVSDTLLLRRSMTDIIEQSGGKVDYVAIIHPDTLEELDVIGERAHAAIAANVGKTRLIDNMRLKG
jgi:pantoate--beta-alanine ligase